MNNYFPLLVILVILLHVFVDNEEDDDDPWKEHYPWNKNKKNETKK